MKTVTIPIKEYKDLLVKAKAFTGPRFKLKLQEVENQIEVEAYDSRRIVSIGKLQLTRPDEFKLLQDYEIFIIKDEL